MQTRIDEREADRTPGNRTKTPRLSGNEEAFTRRIDGRVARTRHRLGEALIALVHEKGFDAITVQEVLDRAGVGRATFYTHFRDNEDLFLSQLDEFLEWFAGALERAGDRSPRVAPVRELFAHVAEGERMYRALQESGRVNDFLDLARGHFARAIEARLRAREDGKIDGDRAVSRACGGPAEDPLRAARAHALAGALFSLLIWWIDRGRPGSPEEMDDLFHGLVA